MVITQEYIESADLSALFEFANLLEKVYN